MVIATNNTTQKQGYKLTEVGMIPEDWKISSWGKLATLEYGKPLSEYENTHGLYPVYVTNGFIGTHTKLLCKHPGVIVGRKGAYRGIHFSKGPFYVIDTAYYLEAKENIDLKWAYYELLTHDINRMDSGSAIPSTSRETFYSLSVIVPPFHEQQAIATALSDVDALITSLDRLIAKKRAIKQATMQQLLTGKVRLAGFSKGLKQAYKRTEVGMIPEDWEVRTLGEIGECFIGLTYQPGNVQSHGLLVLRSSNITNNELTFTDNVYVNIGVPNTLLVRKNDILICVRNGSRDLIGKCALIKENVDKMTFGAFMSLFRTKYACFIFYEFQSQLIKRQIHENIGATINQITNKNLKSFQIPFPKSEIEQQAIASVLADMDAEIAALEQRRDKTRMLKQGMMQELLTGKTRLR